MKTAQKTDITLTLFKLFTLAFFVSAPLAIVQGCAKEATKTETKSETKMEEKKVDGEVKSQKVESEIKSEMKTEPVKADLPKP